MKRMYKILMPLVAIVALALPLNVAAQSQTCQLKIVGEDGYGDGWNGGSLAVMQGTTTVTTFSGAGFAEYESGPELDSTLVTVTSGDTVTFVWTSGMYDDEVTIWIYGPSGALLFTVAGPTAGTIYTLADPCPSCLPPFNLTAQVAGSDVELNWTAGDGTSWQLVWDTGSFNPDSTIASAVTATTNTYSIQNLPDGYYTAYVRTDCGGDYSNWSPVTFVIGGCTIRIEGTDSYGDGWNGGSLAIVQGGRTVRTVTLTSGSSVSANVLVLDDTVTFVWTSGNYDSEVSIDIYDGGGLLIHSVTQPSAGTFYTLNDPCPSCLGVTSLAADSITGSEIYVSWAAGLGSEWLVYLNDSLMGSTTTPEYIFQGLNSNTLYTIGIRNLCSSDDTSGAATIPVRTACVLIDSLPYMADFNSCPTGNSNVFDYCWSFGNTYSTSYHYPYASPIDGNNCLYMYMYGTSYYGYAMLPEIDWNELSTTDMELSFDIWGSSTTTYGGGVIVAIFDSNAYDANSTFDTVAVIIPTGTSYNTRETMYVSLVGRNLVGKRIGFYFKNQKPNNTSSYYYAYIDNVNLHEAPDCLVPTNLTANYIGTDTLNLSWEGMASSYWVEYRPAGVADSVQWIGSEVNDTNVILEPLSANTSYDIRVRSLCNGDTSFALTGNFRTACGLITNLPWTETFNTMATTSSATNIPCWSYIGSGGYVNITNSSTYAHTGNCVRFYPNSSSTTDHILVLPEFDTATSGLEMSFWTRPESASYSGSFSVGYVTSPSQPNSFVEILNIPATSGTTITQYEVTFAGAPDNARIAMRHNVGSTSWYWFVDDIDVHAAPTCLRPANLTVTNATDSELGISFNGSSEASYIVWITNGTTTVDSTVITTTTHSFINLTPSTNYTIHVATLCDGGEVSLETTVTGSTTAVISATELPYTTGFEDATQDTAWTLVNGTYTNKWAFGSATNNGGSRALYISNDNGTTNAYTVSGAPSDVSIYKTFRTTTAGQYAISFDWKATGESTYDYMRAFLVPASVEIAAGQNGIGTTGAPTGWTAIDGGSKLNLQSSWQNVTYIFNVAGAGLYKVVFFWHNDNSMGDNPPAAVDNFAFVQVTCPQPTNIVLDTITYDSLAIHWTAGGSETSWEVTVGNMAPVVVNTNSYATGGLLPRTNYNVRVRAICSATDSSLYASVNYTTECGPNPLPFFRDFDNDAYGYYTEDCWVMGNTAGQSQNSYNNWPYLIAFTGATDDKLLFLNGGAYVYLPEMAAPLNQLELTFDFSSGHDSSVLYLGYVTNPSQPFSSAVIMDTIYHMNYATPEEFRGRVEYSMSNYPANASRLVIASDVVGTGNWIGINELTIDYPPTCGHVTNISYTGVSTTSATLTWTASPNGTPQGYVVEYGPRLFTRGTGTIATTTTNSITLTGLTPMTPYQAYIVTDCGAGDSSVATMPFEFSSACGDLVLPSDTMTFEEYKRSGRSMTNTMPNCWAIDSTSITYSTDSIAPMLYGLNSNDYMALLMYDRTTIAMPSSPVDLDTLMIQFDLDIDDTNMALVVGSVSSQAPGFASTFVPVDTLYYADNGHATIYFVNHSGTNRHIAFQNILLDANSDYAQVFIDNVVVRYAPSCYPVHHATAISANEHDITVDWSDVISAGNWNIEYGPQGFVLGTGATMNTTSHPVTISGLNTATTYDIYIIPICSATDSGETTHLAASTACGVISNFPWTEGFESASAFDCWSQTGDGEWELGTGDYSTGTGSHTGNANVLITHNISGDITKLISPVLSLSGSNAMLSFWHVQRSWTGDIDELRVYYRTDTSDSWHQLAAYTNAIETWTKDSVILPDVSSTYQIAFEMTDSYGYGVAIDDITITGTAGSTCEAPVITGVTASNDNATVTWTSTHDSCYVAITDGDWNNAVAGTLVMTGNYTFGNLTPNTNYTVGVRQRCDEGIYSDWTIQNLTTTDVPCLAVTGLAIVETGFDHVTVNWTPASVETAWNVRIYNTTMDTTVRSTDTVCTVGSLIRGVTYNVSVQPLCGSGATIEGPWCEAINFTTVECQPVTNVTTSNITNSSVKLSWTAAGSNDSEWRIEYGYAGFSRGEGQSVTATTNPYTLTGLERNTDYDVYVATVCEGNMLSSWSTVTSFTTDNNEGIDEAMGESAVSLYPNPATSTVTIDQTMGRADITVIDMNGRTIGQWQATESSLTIDVSSMSKGTYFVRVTGEQATVVRKLVVK